MRFVDTNILVYSVCAAPADAAKAAVAVELLGERDLHLSVQVLQEFYVQVTRPTRSGHLPHAEAVALIRAWMRYPVHAQTPELMQAALESKARFGLSYWDALVIETARAAGCREVLSEDMAGERDYAGVRVVNPFAGRSKSGSS